MTDLMDLGAAINPAAKTEQARREAMGDVLDEALRIFGDDLADRESVEEAIRLRDEGIDSVYENASPEFKLGTNASIEFIARGRDEFTTDAVWARNEQQGVPLPHDNRAMSGAMGIAKAAEWIEPTDRFVPTQRKQAHRRPIRVWRSRIKGVPQP